MSAGIDHDHCAARKLIRARVNLRWMNAVGSLFQLIRKYVFKQFRLRISLEFFVIIIDALVSHEYDFVVFDCVLLIQLCLGCVLLGIGSKLTSRYHSNSGFLSFRLRLPRCGLDGVFCVSAGTQRVAGGLFWAITRFHQAENLGYGTSVAERGNAHLQRGAVRWHSTRKH